MIKKIAFVILVVAAIACGTWGYLYLSKLKRPTTNPLSVLPDTCYVLIETKNLHQLSEKINQGNLMWEELLKTNAIKQFNKTLQKADSLISNSTSSNQFGVQSVYVALYQSKKTELLAAFNLADISTNDLFVSFLMTILSQSFFSFMRRNFMTLSLFTTRHTNNFLFLL